MNCTPVTRICPWRDAHTRLLYCTTFNSLTDLIYLLSYRLWDLRLSDNRIFAGKTIWEGDDVYTILQWYFSLFSLFSCLYETRAFEKEYRFAPIFKIDGRSMEKFETPSKSAPRTVAKWIVRWKTPIDRLSQPHFDYRLLFFKASVRYFHKWILSQWESGPTFVPTLITPGSFSAQTNRPFVERDRLIEIFYHERASYELTFHPAEESGVTKRPSDF